MKVHFQVGLSFGLAVTFLLAGCRVRESEKSQDSVLQASEWCAQVDAVRQGQSSEIEIQAQTITDIQLAELTEVENLEVLKLNRGSISDEGIRAIVSLPKLRQIVLRDSSLSNEGAKQLSQCKSLEIVNIPRSQFGDEAIKHLSQLPQLELLRIGTDRPLSADALKHLTNSKSLRFVHLIGVPLKDDALGPLGAIEGLESLYIDGGEFSDEALSDLLKRRPKLHLHLDQRHHDSDPKSKIHSH